MSWTGRLLLFSFFPLPSVPDVIITFNQIKVSIIWALSFSTSLLLHSFLMQHNLEQLQSCFVAILALSGKSAGAKPGAGPIMAISSGAILKGRVSSARQPANILVKRGCSAGRCFIAPWAVFETWSHFWCRMEQAGAQGLAVNEHGRNKAGSLSCVSSSCVSLPSLHHGLAPERGHPAAHPSVSWRGTVNIQNYLWLLEMRRHVSCLVGEGFPGRALGAAGDGARLCCWAGVWDCSEGNARLLAGGGLQQELCRVCAPWSPIISCFWNVNLYLWEDSTSIFFFIPCRNPSPSSLG